MRFIYILFILAIFNNSFAQLNVTGIVRNSSKIPIPFATLSLKGGHQNKDLQTDSIGSFTFAAVEAGQYSLTAAHVGYDSFSLNIYVHHDTAVNITLQQSGKQLAEVVVVANKQVIEKSAEKLLYNVSQSITATGSNALDAMAKIPGIKINNNEISVVGKGLTKVMVNNRVIQLSGEDLTRYLKSLSANEISAIELITNPSAKYEAEGNAGLINIITRRDKKQGYTGNVQIAAKRYAPGESSVHGIRTFGELTGSANLAYNGDKWSAYGSFNHVQDRHLEGFETDIYYPSQTWLQSDTGIYTYNGFSGIAGVDYKISDKATIGISYLGGMNHYDGSDHVNNPIFNHSGNLDSTLKTYAIYHPVASNNGVSLHSEIKFDTAGRSLFLNADYFSHFRTDRSHFESNSYNASGQYKPEGNTRYYDTNKQVINVYTLKADAEFPTRFANFTFGGKISFINNYSNAFYYNKLEGGGLLYNTNLSNEFDYTENTQAVYAVINKQVDKWKLQGGVRGEQTQTKGYSYTLKQTTVNNYFRLFPSLVINYQQNAGNIYTLLVGRRINRPTFWNLNPFKSLFTAYSYGEGNPYLQPEYNSNIELSHTFKNIVTSTLFFNITDNGFNNVTMAPPNTNLVYTMPLNFIKTYRLGISENVSLKLFTWWESNQQLNFYHTNANSSIINVSNIEGFGLYVASNNSLFFNKRKTLAGALNFWYQFPEVDHIGRSDRYYKLDAGIRATTPDGKWSVAFNLNDAFRESASAVSTTVNGNRQKLTNFQFNRYFQLSINYKFGNKENKQNSRTSGNEDETSRIH